MRWYTRHFRPLLGVRPRAERRRRLRIEPLESREVPAVTGVVFQDGNGDGIRGTRDAGIAGVTVSLFQGETRVATTVTATDGTYTIATLETSANFQLRIDTTQTLLAGRTLVPADQGADDGLDSDATLTGTNATVDFTTDATGSDLTFDAGFAFAAAGTLTLGGLVFNDADDSGTFGTGESGVAGVVVELLNETGETVLNTTTTATDGITRSRGWSTGRTTFGWRRATSAARARWSGSPRVPRRRTTRKMMSTPTATGPRAARWARADSLSAVRSSSPRARNRRTMATPMQIPT